MTVESYSWRNPEIIPATDHPASCVRECTPCALRPSVRSSCKGWVSCTVTSDRHACVNVGGAA